MLENQQMNVRTVLIYKIERILNMTLYYRPHRGGLNEALNEQEKFETIDSLILKHNEIVSIEYYCYDARIMADTFICLNIRNKPLGFAWYSKN